MTRITIIGRATAEVEWLLGTDAPETIAARLGYLTAKHLAERLRAFDRPDLASRLLDDSKGGVN